jgi:hypothetical protein
VRRTVVTLLLALGGAALLAWQVQRVGLSTIRDGFGAVGAGFLVILALSFARFVLRSYAWTVLIGRGVPLSSAIAATIAGDALGNLTPLGLLASEPAKAIAVGRHVEPARALAALTAENFFYSVSVALLVIASAGAMLAAFTLPDSVRWSGWISLGAMGVVVAGAVWLAWQRPAVASALLSRIPSTRVRAILDRVRAFEADAYAATGAGTSRVRTVVVCHLLFHALSFVESWFTFWLLTGVTSLLPALVFDGFNRVVNIVAKPVPMKLGVEEGGTAILAAAIGYPSHAGFVLGLVRKARVFVWAVVGVALMVRLRRVRR